MATCIVCKLVENTQTINFTCKAASNTNLDQDVNVLEYKSYKCNILV